MQPTMNFTAGKNKKWNYLVDSMFFGAVLTSSFDIFLVLVLGALPSAVHSCFRWL